MRGSVTSQEEEDTDGSLFHSVSLKGVHDVRTVRRQMFENHEDLLHQKMTMLVPLSWTSGPKFVLSRFQQGLLQKKYF